MAAVTLNELDKTYNHGKKDAFQAVKQIDLEIEDGEFMVLVGPSGCGKTTTLRMIAGLEEITSGTLQIGDIVMNDVLPKNRGIAMVFQNYGLYPHMSVYDNMAFALKLLKLSKEEIKTRVEQAAEILGLDALLERKPKALSGGQRQRVAVGRAIVRQPKVFLFDEPLSNLDAKMRVQMRTEISRLHSHLGTTMIYVTHDQVEAMTMGDRICVMKDGEIMQVATPMTVYNHPANMFVAGFIGSPPMNFLPGKIVTSGNENTFLEDLETANSDPATVLLGSSVKSLVEGHQGKPVHLGIRPEFISYSIQDNGKIPVTIDLVEPLGSETYVYLKTNSGQTIICRTSTMVNEKVGDSVFMTFDEDRITFFDSETGLAIAR